MASVSYRLMAIIEIGSTGIRLLVAELFKNGQWQVVDRASKPVSLGRDVFTDGNISRETLLNSIAVLKSYKELINGWGIKDGDVHVIATSALREARNRDMFIDRVFLQTGFTINVVEGIEENRLMYVAVKWALGHDRPQFNRSNSVIIEVGGGSTELMLLRRGKMVAAHSLRLGTILIDQQVRQSFGTPHYLKRYLTECVLNTCESLTKEMDLRHVRTFIVAGSDARFVANRFGLEINKNCWIIGRQVFIDFVDRIENYSVEECVQKLRIPYAEAEGIIPGLLTYKLFLEQTSATEVIVPNASIREGMLITLASGIESDLQEEFFSQIIASAINLGRKYRFDEEHARHVRMLALRLFDELRPIHGLERRSRLFLEIGALLHDIGMFIRSSGHHKHSQYIIANSEIFGLHQDELNIISNVVRYHRKAPPNSTHIAYLALQREERILVLKLAAILRIADALDRGHAQRIRDFTLEIRDDTILIRLSDEQDITMERIGIEEKADLFMNVYGYRVLLA
ncbi:HD domain-containing protein [Treponema sp. J25]|uniref:Ppx/GppA phosphatase family protein n=1 Tax=Treponema sp. J25 TaxID=2094121 RepID=UPI0010445E37|nr:HD domain-containing protein [Treponema sp. J25]TCW61683.1 phosphatase [Treponema sp. J25]